MNSNKVFLEGPAGTGKTTAAVTHLLGLLASGVPARSILVLVPQRTLAAPYTEALRRPTIDAGGLVTIFTVGGLAQRMVDLFWPLIAEQAGFAHPDLPPTFLTLETAQYYMARLVRPLLDQGYFETVVIDRNRLYSQILDNLNKAAVVGFPHTEIGERLKAAWGGEKSQMRIYDEAQACATRFREYCLAHNLLDFSLQLEVFIKHLWSLSLCRDYLLTTYTHLIVDNLEEDTPVAHDLVREWLPHCRSALLVYDHRAGYRRFLGADPENALTLADLCDERIAFTASFATSPDLESFGTHLAHALDRPTSRPDINVRAERAKPSGLESSPAGALLSQPDASASGAPSIPALPSILSIPSLPSPRYHPQMLDWVADQIAALVHEQHVPPGEIAVLAPFLTDALRFALTNRLERKGVPARSHRPSRALREEPATRCLLTLAALAHPEWKMCPTRFDVVYALMQAIDGLDLVRAQLLAEIVYRVRDGAPTLSSFDLLKPDVQERLTFALGNRYERLRAWVEDYVTNSQPSPSTAGRSPEPFDHFLSRLFGEVLSQAGYGFHRNYDAGQVAANLIESVQKFRWVARPAPRNTEHATRNTQHASRFTFHASRLGQEYIEMVEDGVIAAQYIRSWRLQPEDAVLLAPAYTFIIANRPVDYQFWLNVGGRGWWERLYQPLTHPYVLSRGWPLDAVWTDTDEVEARQEALYRLTLGLIRRCRRKIYLGLSELDELGNEQKGPLLQAIQRILRHLPAETET